MRKTKWIFIVLLLILACTLIAGILFTRSESSYKQKYIGNDTKIIRDLAYIDNIVAQISEDNCVREILPIESENKKLSIYAFELNRNGKYKVLLTGAIHGEEPGGALALAKIIDDNLEYAKKYPQINFTIIPVMNPWGYIHGSRYNKKGINIGVDFTLQNTDEAKAITRYLQNRKFDLAIDLHESNGSSNYVLVHSKKGIEEVSQIIRQISDNEIKIAESPTMKPFKILANEKGISYYPAISSIFERISARETLFVWLKNRGLCDDIYAIETGKKSDISIRVEFDNILIFGLINKLITTK